MYIERELWFREAYKARAVEEQLALVGDSDSVPLHQIMPTVEWIRRQLTEWFGREEP